MISPTRPSRPSFARLESAGSRKGTRVKSAMIATMKSDAAKRYLADLGRKYLWWDPVGDDPHSEDRIIAQAMNLGTFDDILVLEQTLGEHRLVEIMRQPAKKKPCK